MKNDQKNPTKLLQIEAKQPKRETKWQGLYVSLSHLTITYEGYVGQSINRLNMSYRQKVEV